MPSKGSARLEGKVAVITGGASGIGEAASRLFVEHGAVVVIADIQDELGREVVASINSEKVSYHRCDVRDEEQVAETVKYAVEKYGKLDIMFSNAGVLGSVSSILELDIDGMDKVMAINVRGMAACVKHGARAMVEGKVKGSIICTASVSSCIGGTGPHSYTASKHAVVGLVKGACSELGLYGIRVNAVSPFGVATPLACAAAGLKPDEVEEHIMGIGNLKGVALKAKHVAEAALYLASDESGYVSGLNMVLDGGFSVVGDVTGSMTQ